ncbi:MAG: hypothetical protein GXO88_03990 [Chlorobi bacterium]|nr:hypothetical protein [Chlorobiota bacterium]
MSELDIAKIKQFTVKNIAKNNSEVRNLSFPPSVAEDFETKEKNGNVLKNWKRFTGDGGGYLNYDADWKSEFLKAVTGNVLSANFVYNKEDTVLSWFEYRGTIAEKKINDGIMPLQAKYYVEASFCPVFVPGSKVWRKEYTLQGYFVDGGHYVEVMYLTENDGKDWFVAVWQYDIDQSSGAEKDWLVLGKYFPVQEKGFGWWGTIGMEIDRKAGEVVPFHNGRPLVKAPLKTNLIKTEHRVRTNVRVTNTLMKVDNFKIYVF